MVLFTCHYRVFLRLKIYFTLWGRKEKLENSVIRIERRCKTKFNLFKTLTLTYTFVFNSYVGQNLWISVLLNKRQNKTKNRTTGIGTFFLPLTKFLMKLVHKSIIPKRRIPLRQSSIQRKVKVQDYFPLFRSS